MTFDQPVAFLFLSGALITLSLPCTRKQARVAFFLISLVFLVLNYKNAVGSLAILIFSAGLHFAALHLMLALPTSRAKSVTHYSWLILTLIGFAIFKNYGWILNIFASSDQFGFTQGFVTVGASFLLFRQIHLSIEVRDSTRSRVPILDYINYNFSFLTFIAGPIQRYEDFQDQFGEVSQSTSTITSREVLIGLNRVMFGYFRMFVVGAYFQSLAQPEIFLDRPDVRHFLVFLFAYPLYMYMNFAGYCDIVIGLARCIGFRLPENFNHPYLARNMVEFWSRWHVTLSQFFRDYLYFPLHISMSRRIPRSASMILLTFFSFMVMGVWHGNSPGFAIFGLMHGLGVVAANLYTDFLRRSLGKERFLNYGQDLRVRCIAVALCQVFVALSFLPFHCSENDISRIWSQVILLVGLG